MGIGRNLRDMKWNGMNKLKAKYQTALKLITNLLLKFSFEKK